MIVEIERSALRKNLFLPGVIIAAFGMPLTIFVFDILSPPGPYSDTFIIAREVSIIFIPVLLLFYIVKVEGPNLESVGLTGKNWGKSILLALLTLVATYVVAGIVLFSLQLLNVPLGSGDSQRYDSVSSLSITLIMFRAGFGEEICYRGYLMERLQSKYNNWIIYFLMPLIVFSLCHYRQGIAGIVLSFFLGGVLAYVYWKKRDLKANIMAHFLGDFIPNVLVPLFVN